MTRASRLKLADTDSMNLTEELGLKDWETKRARWLPRRVDQL